MNALQNFVAGLLRPIVAELLDEMNVVTSDQLAARMEPLEARMAEIEDEAFDQLGTLIGVVVAEVASLNSGIAQKDQALADANALISSLQGQLDGAQADQAAAVQTAVASALDTDSQADGARVLGYVDQLKAAVPAAEVPDVPVPDPGQPAEPPADSGVEVPQVDPTPTPEPTDTGASTDDGTVQG